MTDLGNIVSFLADGGTILVTFWRLRAINTQFKKAFKRLATRAPGLTISLSGETRCLEHVPKFLIKLKSIRTLNLALDSIETRMYSAIVRSLPPRLTAFSVQYKFPSMQNAALLALCMPPTLEHLSLAGSDLSGDKLHPICQQFQSLPYLRTLCLKNCNLDGGASVLLNYHLSRLQQLQLLNISVNDTDRSSLIPSRFELRTVVSAIPGSLLSLDISRCSVTADDLREMMKTLPRGLRELRIDMRDRGSFPASSASILSELICSLPELEVLSCCTLDLSEFFPESTWLNLSTKLRILNMSSNNLDSIATKLFWNLHRYPLLEEFQLAENDITDSIALGTPILPHNLKVLVLSHNLFSPEGFAHLVRLLPPSLVVLDVNDCCCIDGTVLDDLIKKLPRLTELKTLNIGNGHIRPQLGLHADEIKQLAQNVSKGLTVLDISAHRLGLDSVEVVVDIIDMLPNLRELCLRQTHLALNKTAKAILTQVRPWSTNISF
eukprot:GILJ01008471.1.p1 GENE.GILJ01008471.1~~GILJ01008471.1.p1  ORF type:complete len:545 (+),score=57.35 GILJ01008471.1:158-1636(+)